MVSYTLRPHWNTPNHDRTEQFGFHGIARKADFSKIDVGVVPTLAQHVLVVVSMATMLFLDKTMKFREIAIIQKLIDIEA